MRIGIEMLAAQSAGRARGTGRYARALVRQLLRETRHEWFLYYYEGLPAANCVSESPWSVEGEAPGDWTNAEQSVPCAGEASVTRRTLSVQEGLPARVETLLRTNPDRLDLLLLTCPLEHFRGYSRPSRGYLLVCLLRTSLLFRAP